MDTSSNGTDRIARAKPGAIRVQSEAKESGISAIRNGAGRLVSRIGRINGVPTYAGD